MVMPVGLVSLGQAVASEEELVSADVLVCELELAICRLFQIDATERLPKTFKVVGFIRAP